MAIARSLINRPQVLFADEPTGNLDSRTSEEILQIFEQLNQVDGITLIMVTHDPGVAQHAQRIIRIKDGLIEGGGARACGRRVLKLFRTRWLFWRCATISCGRR